MHILLLSRLPNKQSERRLQDAAISRGHEVTTLKYNDISLLVADTAHELYHPEVESFTFDAVVPRLGRSNIGYGISILRQLELNNVYTPNSSAGISRIHNYVRLIQLLTHKSIPVPKTFVSKTGIVSAEVLERLGLPVLLHRDQDNGGSLLIETRKTLDSILQVISTRNEPTILQEFPVKTEVSRYRAFVVGGRIVASIKEDDKPQGQPKPMPLSAAGAKIAAKVATALSLKIYEVELVDAKGQVKVISINPEPDIDYYEKITGRNVAEKIIEYIEQNAKQRNRKDRVGA